MVGDCGFVVAAGLGAWTAWECSEECYLRGPCDCLGNSSIGYWAGVFGYKCWGLLRSSTNNKSVCVAGASLVFLFFIFYFFVWFSMSDVG